MEHIKALPLGVVGNRASRENRPVRDRRTETFLTALQQDKREGWKQLAACKYESKDTFFLDPGASAYEAHQLCRQCPVRYECLKYGVGEQNGIWGGYGSKILNGIRAELNKGQSWRQAVAKVTGYQPDDLTWIPE